MLFESISFIRFQWFLTTCGYMEKDGRQNGGHTFSPYKYNICCLPNASQLYGSFRISSMLHFSSIALTPRMGFLHFYPYCANCNKSRLLFSSAEMFKKPLWQTVWTQIRLLEQSVLGPHWLLSILNLSVMLGNYLQQRTSADKIFRCIFFLAL